MPQARNSTANRPADPLRTPISAPPAPSRHLFRFQLQIALSGTLLLSLALGCASPGPPRPPSLKLPQPVTDLTAQRIGDHVLLKWTTPSKTTDNLAIKGDLTTRICRISLAPSNPNTPRPPQPPPSNNQPATPAPCTPALTLTVHPGATTATDTLPAVLTSDPITLLDYRVEIDNSTGHFAGPSNAAFAPAGPTPPPVAALRATASPTGVILEWSPLGQPVPAAVVDSVELDRVDLTLSATRQLQTETKSGPPQPLQTAGREIPEVHLRAKAIPITSNSQPASQPAATAPEPSATALAPSGTALEPSGTIDQTARFGDLYRYTAQRVRSVTLNGHALELRSLISEPVTIPYRDTFPPAIPTGLYAVSGQTAPATSNQQPATSTPLAIDLSWQPNSEPDLAGYIVYRRQLPNPSQTSVPTNQPPVPPNQQSATPSRLTPTPLSGPAYRDLTAIPGQTYAYSITAIDTSGNESKPSPEVEETLPQP